LNQVPRPAGLAAVNAALARSPLRWTAGDDAGDPAEAAGRGWFRGARECAGHLAALTGAPISPAWAFGEEWPAVAAGEWLVAPGMPLVLDPAGGVGPDAAYTRRGSAVCREAAGREEVFLTTDAAAPRPGRRFDLLWFGESERFTVRDGTLEVEDLFARLELPVEQRILERLLIRNRRVDGEILDGIGLHPLHSPATITVHRAAALHPDETWRDPEVFLRARADIERTERCAEHIVTHNVLGTRTVYGFEQRDDGWEAAVESGESLMTAFSMRRANESLALTATLHFSVDPLAPGVRGRLAFDLRSDLVALS